MRSEAELTAAHELLRAQAAWQEQYGRTEVWRWLVAGAAEALAWVVGADERGMALAGWLAADVERYLRDGYSDLPLFSNGGA
jgi:hypothetical protein